MTTVIADREGCPKSSRANSAAFLSRRTLASARGCFCPWTFELDMYVPAARLIKQKRAQPLSQTTVLVSGGHSSNTLQRVHVCALFCFDWHTGRGSVTSAACFRTHWVRAAISAISGGMV